MSRNPVFFNIVPSPPDPRDWNTEPVFDEHVRKPRRYLDLRHELKPIRNQGKQGTSAAHVGVCMAEYQVRKNKLLKKQLLSPQFLYDQREDQEKSTMCGREIMKILGNIGVCQETSYPYEKSKEKTEVEANLLEEASLCKIQNYARVHTISSLKKALFVNGPCFISFPVYNHTVKMWVQHKGEVCLGGHAMTVVGYDKKGFILRNSWGLYWKTKGYCHFPYKDWGCQYEIWTIVKPESYLIPRWKITEWTHKYVKRGYKWTSRKVLEYLGIDLSEIQKRAPEPNTIVIETKKEVGLGEIFPENDTFEQTAEDATN